jgi:predicted TIM-barrel fold metal-dependent hydrolase
MGAFGSKMRQRSSRFESVGADNLLFETDFPHPTSMSPGPVTAAMRPDDYLQGTFGDLPENILRKILHDNAARIYHLD